MTTRCVCLAGYHNMKCNRPCWRRAAKKMTTIHNLRSVESIQESHYRIIQLTTCHKYLPYTFNYYRVSLIGNKYMYSETFVYWSPLGCSELAAIQRWPDYTVYFQQGSPLWDMIRWLFKRGDRFAIWLL